MTSYIIEGIADLQDNSKFVIIPDLTFSEPISIPPNATLKIKLRMSTMLYVQQLSREEKLKQFSPQVSMPDNWTVEDDHMIIYLILAKSMLLSTMRRRMESSVP